MRRTTRTIAALLPLCAVLLAAPARAAEDEHALSVGPRYAGVFTTGEDAHGVGLGLGYRYGLSDFFTLLVDGGYAVLPAAPEHFAFVRVGATYTIDALEWVPWLGLALGGYVTPTAGKRLDGGASVGVGLDYRAQREWSVGLDVWYHALFRQLDTVPAVLTAGLNLTWYLD